MENLTDEQRVAVLSPLSKHCIVTAGPGSGKTSFLVHRVARILKEVPGAKIYCISFTNESARELNRRLYDLKSQAQVTCSTLHRFCLQGLKSLRLQDEGPLRVIKGNSHLVQYMRQLISPSDCLKLVQGLLCSKEDSLGDEVEVDEEFHDDMDESGNSTAEDDVSHTSDVKPYFRLIDACRLERECGSGMSSGSSRIKRLSENFYLALRNAGVVDLSTIVSEFLRNSDLLRNYVASVCEFLAIDEFQDLDTNQLRLVKSLADLGITITAVGDSNQRIYSWRRLGETKRQKSGTNFDTFTIELEEKPILHPFALNLRSTPDIVRLSNNLIGSVISRSLKTNTGIACGVVCRHFYDETARVNQFITILKSRNELASSAVLFRYNFERERFVKNLAKNDIPFHGKLISHPNGPVAVKRSKSMSALLCILNASTWEAEACIEAIKLNCSGKAEIEIIARFLEEQDLSGDSEDTEKRLVAIIQSKSPNMKCKAVICSALKKIRSVAKQACGKGSVEMSISEFKIKRTKDIKDFMVKVEKFESVADILRMVKENDNAFINSRTTKQGIFVGTIHASKGREWKTVILPFLNEGTLPSERANVDEERRVMYVAMTRAVDSLLITCNESGPPSRFLQDAKIPLTPNFNEFTSLYTSTR